MAWWNSITNWGWWDAVNQENIDRNANLSDYVTRMKFVFVRRRINATFTAKTEGNAPNSTGRITQRIQFVLTLPAYPGFQATIMTGAPRLDIPPEQWIDMLLGYAQAGPRGPYSAFYFPAENPEGHEE